MQDFPSIRDVGRFRFQSVPPEPESDTLTAESVAVQTIEHNADLAEKYVGGDLAVFGVLQARALALAAGRLKEQEVKDTLMRKLGASI